MPPPATVMVLQLWGGGQQVGQSDRSAVAPVVLPTGRTCRPHVDHGTTSVDQRWGSLSVGGRPYHHTHDIPWPIVVAREPGYSRPPIFPEAPPGEHERTSRHTGEAIY